VLNIFILVHFFGGVANANLVTRPMSSEPVYSEQILGISGVILMQASSEVRLTIQGVRMTLGNAVDCPNVRTDDGVFVPVSYLAPSIAIGDRVKVTGFMAVTTTCKGKVLVAEEVITPTK
jgi:hypothetical protein